MEKFLVNGGKSLKGIIKVHGAKNSALPILASTIIIDGVSEIHNCPNLSDVKTAIKILEYLGCKVIVEDDVVIVDSRSVERFDIPEYLMREMRSSIIFLGSITSRMKKSELSAPGGCDIGLRPIDIHLSAMKRLGIEVCEGSAVIKCSAENGIKGTKIVLPFPSVGATENIIIASVLAKGETTIINAAREPEIEDLADFLNGAGAKITGVKDGTIKIKGVNKLYSSSHSVIPDRILATTYMCAAAITNGDLLLTDVKNSHIASIISEFDDMGVKIQLDKNKIRIKNDKRFRRLKEIKTMPYPGFPTDCQAPIMSMLSVAKGTSTVVENIFESRYKHVPELKRMGAKITVNDKVAVVEGVKKLTPANVIATDLRGGAALVVAALNADGVSEISDIYHIDRGYEKMENVLSSVGAQIKRIAYEREKN